MEEMSVVEMGVVERMVQRMVVELDGNGRG